MAKRIIPVTLPTRLQRDGIDCVLTVHATFAQADVVDYRGGRPSKHDTEDALYAAKQVLRRRYPARARGLGLFDPYGARGEVSSWRILFPSNANPAPRRRRRRAR